MLIRSNWRLLIALTSGTSTSIQLCLLPWGCGGCQGGNTSLGLSSLVTLLIWLFGLVPLFCLRYLKWLTEVLGSRVLSLWYGALWRVPWAQPLPTGGSAQQAVPSCPRRERVDFCFQPPVKALQRLSTKQRGY